MIKSFVSADLKELFETGKNRRLGQLAKRAKGRLDALNATNDLRTLFLPGFELHKYPNFKNRWSISISGHWRILFDWINNEAHNVDLDQPH